MRKIKEVLRLHAAGRSQQQISRSCGIGRSTVGEYLQRAQAAGISWPLPEPLDEAELERQLFPPPPSVPATARGVPDWAGMHQEGARA